MGDEVLNNTLWGVNLSYNTNFLWLTNLLNKIPTVNATAPSTLALTAEFAQLLPHKSKNGSSQGTSYFDDFESTQTGLDMIFVMCKIELCYRCIISIECLLRKTRH